VNKNDYGWTESFGFLHKQGYFPMVMTEWGLDSYEKALQGGWYPTDLLSYVHSNNIGYAAWAWVQDRIDYPSLIDHKLRPLTGGCGMEENKWYPGPGQLVFNDLQKNHRYTMAYQNLHYFSIFIFVYKWIRKKIYKTYL
jgi:hypothetical protein